MSEPVLQVKGLKTYYYTEEGVVPAVDGLDFEVEPGETFAIVGESGCGKSVTSLSILRLIPSPPGKIIDGEIIYHGQDLVKKSEREMRNIRGNDISMIFQEPMTSLNPVFTVGQQIGESFRFHQQMGKAEMLKKSIEMLRLVGIPEPEHVMSVIRYISDRVGVMYLGHLVEEGDTDEVFDHPQHPYTRTLMSAVPSIDPRDNRQRILLEGDLPSPIDPPSGCVFHTRCPWATEACKTASCELREVRAGHYAACSRGKQE